MSDLDPRRNPKSATTRSVAQFNTSLMIDALRSHGAMSLRELAERTGLSRATVNRLADELVAQRLLIDERQAERTGGRPARIFRYNGAHRGVLAIDLGPQKTTAAVIDTDGSPVYREVRPTASTGSEAESQQVFDQLLLFAQDMLEQTRARCEVLAVAISVPGVVRPESGLVEFAPALKWWSMPLAQRLQDRLRLPVFAENDVNLMVLAEHRRGAGVGMNDVVALSMGTGVGAGLILDGRLHRGWLGGAGELGYMLIEPASLKQTWPQFGDFESRLGKVAIERRAAEIGLPGVSELFSAARAGNGPAVAVVDELSDILALAIANISVLVSPQIVLIGGQVGRVADQLIAGVRERLVARIPTVPRIAPAQLVDAELIGASELAIDHIMRGNSLSLGS